MERQALYDHSSKHCAWNVNVFIPVIFFRSKTICGSGASGWGGGGGGVGGGGGGGELTRNTILYYETFQLMTHVNVGNRN